MFPSPSTAPLHHRAKSTDAHSLALCLATLSSGAALLVAGAPLLFEARPPLRLTASPGPVAAGVADRVGRASRLAAEVGHIKGGMARGDSAMGRLPADSEAVRAAVERYNDELEKLARSRQANRDAQRRVVEASRDYGEARAELASFASNAYRVNTGFNPMSEAIAGTGGPQGFMDRAAMLEMLAHRRTAIIGRVEEARNVAETYRRQAESALDEQRVATRRAEEAERAAQTAASRQRTALRRV